MKLSHFSNTSAGGEHGYNAKGPVSPLKLPNLRFQVEACSCFKFSFRSEFCSVQIRIHRSYIKKRQRSHLKLPQTPGTRQVEAGKPVMLSLTGL